MKRVSLPSICKLSMLILIENGDFQQYSSDILALTASTEIEKA